MATVSDAVRQRTQAKIDAMEPKQRELLRAILIRTHHRMRCVYHEVSTEKNKELHLPRYDISPAIFGEGCECRGEAMKWNDCNV